MAFRMVKLIWILFFYVVFESPNVLGYDQVQAEKTIPLASRKATPTILRISQDGQYWLLDQSNNTLQLLSEEGTIVKVLKPGKKKESLFKEPVDFVFSNNGDLVVSDPGLGRVAWISSGKLVSFIKIEKPGAVAVSRDDIVAIGDLAEKAVRVCSADGVLLYFLVPGATDKLKSITAMAFAKDGTLLVLDGEQGQLHRFSPDRTYLGATKDLNNANGLAVDDYGFAYVSLKEGRWKEISPSGDVVGTFGAKGKNPGQLSEPVGLALHSSERLSVLEKGNVRIQIFKIQNSKKDTPLKPQPASRLQVRQGSAIQGSYTSGVVLKKGGLALLSPRTSEIKLLDDKGAAKKALSFKGKTKLGLKEPVSLTQDKNGDLWVVDAGDHRLKKIDFESGVVETFGEKGKKEGGLLDPRILALRPDQSFVIADRGGSRVQVMNSKGLFLFSVGGKEKSPGRFKTATGIAVNADLIAVADNETKGLYFYDPNGKFIRSLANKKGEAPFWKDLVSVVSDEDGRFYAFDKEAHRIRVFDAAGQFLGDFSVEGTSLASVHGHTVLLLREKDIQLYQVHVVPRAPAKFVAADDAGSIRATWNKLPEAGEYRVYRASESSPYQPLITTKTNETLDTDVVAGVKYQYAVTGINALGYEGNWAFSETIKASRRKDVSLISITTMTFEPIFTAAFKSYTQKSVGSIVLKNNDSQAYRDIKVSIGLKKYTDFHTESMVKVLEAGAEKEVFLTLTLNDHVLELTENTPVQAEVMLQYFEDNTQKSVTQNVPLTLYSRNAIAWEDMARISSFVTPRDVPIVDFSRAAIRSFLNPLKSTPLPKQLAKVALIVESVGALGITYAPDPKTPYADVGGKPDVLDYVQFPRETLSRKIGDCDDTTVLLSALIESIGIETMVVDIPGHVFLMADAGEEDPDLLGLPLERFVEHGGRFWIPIETTRLNKGFLEVWQNAATKVSTAKEKGNIRFVSVFESSKKYPPVTLVDKEPAAPPYPEEKLKTSFPALLEKLQKERYQFQVAALQDEIRKNPADTMLHVQLGMVHVEGGNYPEARNIFTASSKDASPDVQAAAFNNLGNLDYLENKYDQAELHYADAAKISPDDGGVLINQARTAWKLNKLDKAKGFLAQAKSKITDWKDFVSDLPAELLPAN